MFCLGVWRGRKRKILEKMKEHVKEIVETRRGGLCYFS